ISLSQRGKAGSLVIHQIWAGRDLRGPLRVKKRPTGPAFGCLLSPGADMDHVIATPFSRTRTFASAPPAAAVPAPIRVVPAAVVETFLLDATQSTFAPDRWRPSPSVARTRPPTRIRRYRLRPHRSRRYRTTAE